MAQELMEFRMLALLIAIGIVYITADIYRRTEEHGWWYVKIAFATVGLWAFGYLTMQLTGLQATFIVDGLGMAGTALCLFLAGIAFVCRDFNLPVHEKITIDRAVWYAIGILVLAGIGGFVRIGFEGMFSALYVAALLLLLPALYWFGKIHRAARTRISASVFGGMAALTVGQMLVVYATTFCGQGASQSIIAACDRYAYQLSAVSLPMVPFDDLGVTVAAAGGPVLILGGVFLWAYAAFVYHHHLVLRGKITGIAGEVTEILGTREGRRTITNAVDHVHAIDVRFVGDSLRIHLPKVVQSTIFANARQEIVKELGFVMRGETRQQERAESVIPEPGEEEDDWDEESPIEAQITAAVNWFTSFVKKFFNKE